MTIEFHPITVDNLRPVGRLEVGPGQENFVAPNLVSIAESKFFPDWEPLAIHADGELVGFIMWGQDPEGDPFEWWIIRFMIAEEFQGRGYGREALMVALGKLMAKEDCEAILLSLEPENELAKRMYVAAGFEDTGRIEEGEMVFRLDWE